MATWDHSPGQPAATMQALRVLIAVGLGQRNPLGLAFNAMPTPATPPPRIAPARAT